MQPAQQACFPASWFPPCSPVPIWLAGRSSRRRVFSEWAGGAAGGAGGGGAVRGALQPQCQPWGSRLQPCTRILLTLIVRGRQEEFLVCRGDNFPRSYQEEQDPERFSQAWGVIVSSSQKQFIPPQVPTGSCRYTSILLHARPETIHSGVPKQGLRLWEWHGDGVCGCRSDMSDSGCWPTDGILTGRGGNSTNPGTIPKKKRKKNGTLP